MGDRSLDAPEKLYKIDSSLGSLVQGLIWQTCFKDMVCVGCFLG